MRILQIHNQYKEWGGENAVVKNEKSILNEAGHNVVNIEVSNNTIHSLLTDRRQWYQYMKSFLQQESFDVAHIHNIYSVIGNDIYSLISKHKIPIIQTLHNYRLLCTNAVFLDSSNKVCELCAKGNFINGVIKKCYRNSYLQSSFMSWQLTEGRTAALKHVDKFIAVSDFVKQKYIEHGFHEDHIVVKPNHVKKPTEVGNLTDKGYAMYIGRLSPEKGIINLVKAFKILDYKLKIVGDGPLKKDLQRLSSGASNIEFLGHIQGEDKARLLRETSFVVVPSECYETFGMVIQEAYNYKKTVLAANIGALPYYVENKDHLFEPGNFSDLYKVVKNYIYNKKIGTVQENKNIRSKSHDDPANDLINIYKEAINSKIEA